MTEEPKTTGQTAQNGAGDAWEEYTIAELEKKIKSDPSTVYFSVDAIRDKKSRRKLVDPRGVLTAQILRNLYESWELSSDQIIRVTKSAEFFDQQDEAAKTTGYYTGQLYRYLSRIFAEEKPSYKVELQGLSGLALQMLETLFSFDEVGNTLIHPDELRTRSSYLDHLVNTAVYWLGAFAALNKQRCQAPGSIEVWKSRDKTELRKAGIQPERMATVSLFYDVYGIKFAPLEFEARKKGDLSLVISGFFGALFHDVALLDQPRILLPGGEITDLLRAHPDKGNELIKQRLTVLSDERPLTRSVIKNHHERLDGSGYPGKKGEKDIHLFSRILAVCDTFDELTTVACRGKAIHYLALNAGRGFDGEAVRTFLAVLKPYVEGETLPVYEDKKKDPVMRCRVEKIQNRFRPIVSIQEAYDADNKGRAGAPLDLADPNNRIFFI